MFWSVTKPASSYDASIFSPEPGILTPENNSLDRNKTISSEAIETGVENNEEHNNEQDEFASQSETNT